jgi:trimethylamine:corrinoid methyltransferase-like protein
MSTTHPRLQGSCTPATLVTILNQSFAKEITGLTFMSMQRPRQRPS